MQYPVCLAIIITLIVYFVGSTSNVTRLITRDEKIQISFWIDENKLFFVLNGTVGLGWFGVGLNNLPQMPQADCIWIRNDFGKGVQVVDAYTTGRYLPVIGNTSYLSVTSTSITNSTLNVELFRPLYSVNPQHVSVKIDGTTQYLIWAHGKSQGPFSDLKQHSNAGIFSVNFKTGKTSTYETPKLWEVHALCMFFAWGVLVPVGIVFARYGRKNPYWFHIHRGIQSLALTLFIIGLILALTMPVYHRDKEHRHAKIGLALFIIIVLQFVAAVFRPDKKHHKRRTIWYYLHFTFGFLLIVLSWINIAFGQKLYGSEEPTRSLYFTYIALWILIFFILEIIKQIKNRKYKNQVQEQENDTKIDESVELVNK